MIPHQCWCAWTNVPDQQQRKDRFHHEFDSSKASFTAFGKPRLAKKMVRLEQVRQPKTGKTPLNNNSVSTAAINKMMSYSAWKIEGIAFFLTHSQGLPTMIGEEKHHPLFPHWAANILSSKSKGLLFSHFPTKNCCSLEVNVATPDFKQPKSSDFLDMMIWPMDWWMLFDFYPLHLETQKAMPWNQRQQTSNTRDVVFLRWPVVCALMPSVGGTSSYRSLEAKQWHNSCATLSGGRTFQVSKWLVYYCN